VVDCVSEEGDDSQAKRMKRSRAIKCDGHNWGTKGMYVILILGLLFFFSINFCLIDCFLLILDCLGLLSRLVFFSFALLIDCFYIYFVFLAYVWKVLVFADSIVVSMVLFRRRGPLDETQKKCMVRRKGNLRSVFLYLVCSFLSLLFPIEFTLIWSTFH